MKTGNGFPPALYSVFKLMWFRAHEPDWFGRAATILGTKDYINYRLCGVRATDFSYASGTSRKNACASSPARESLQIGTVGRSRFPAASSGTTPSE